MVYGRELVAAVNERGWNLYDSTDLPDNFPFSDDISRVVRSGPSQTLQVDHRYVFLTICDEPSNPNSLIAAMKRVAKSLDGNCSTIQINRQEFPANGFRIANNNRVIIVPCKLNLPYEEAVAAARTLFNTKTLRYD